MTDRLWLQGNAIRSEHNTVGAASHSGWAKSTSLSNMQARQTICIRSFKFLFCEKHELLRRLCRDPDEATDHCARSRGLVTAPATQAECCR
jgi:hypothetical protein